MRRRRHDARHPKSRGVGESAVFVRSSPFGMANITMSASFPEVRRVAFGQDELHDQQAAVADVLDLSEASFAPERPAH